MNTRNKNNQGFSLFELIAVLLIISVVSIVVVSRWAGSANVLIGQIDIIKAHLRYAQSKAMSTSSNWYVHFEISPSPGQYTLYNSAGVKQYFPRELKKEYEYSVDLKQGITLDADTYILFDRLGRPYLNNTGADGTQLTEVKTIVSASVGNVEIRPETGFIP
ncbi:MAG: prepilin-type N-terminal cleavage/methylation domain-containing protein [Proteobacteria bacterium]|nr:prepilin-type N-terminal cleavage/methylation domain-containing protein [Pseudomonadota bacterium]